MYIYIYVRMYVRMYGWIDRCLPHLSKVASLAGGRADEAAGAVDHDEVLCVGVSLCGEGEDGVREGGSEGEAARRGALVGARVGVVVGGGRHLLLEGELGTEGDIYRLNVGLCHDWGNLVYRDGNLLGRLICF